MNYVAVIVVELATGAIKTDYKGTRMILPIVSVFQSAESSRKSVLLIVGVIIHSSVHPFAHIDGHLDIRL